MNIPLAVVGLIEWVAATAIMVVIVIVIVFLRGRIFTSASAPGNILCITSILLVSLTPVILWIAAFSHEVQTGKTVDSVMIKSLSCEISCSVFRYL